jgi:hypothetical protein
MKVILLVIPLAFILSGCALLLEGGLAEGVALESAAGLEVGATEISVSDGLFETARDRGVLSSALDDITARGTRTGRMGMTPTGKLFADGKVIGQIDPGTGDIMGPRGVPAGYLSAEDARIYEFGRNGQPTAIAELRGFTRENGVSLRSTPYGSTIRVLQDRVNMEVLKIQNGRYLIRLPDQTVGWVPASDVSLLILSLAQSQHHCVQQHSGELVFREGNTLQFSNCQEQNGIYSVQTTDGLQDFQETDVAEVIVGGPTPAVGYRSFHSGYSFESAILRTQPRMIWANYRPHYAPETIMEVQKQFPREFIDRQYPRTDRTNPYRRSLSGYHGRRPDAARTTDMVRHFQRNTVRPGRSQFQFRSRPYPVTGSFVRPTYGPMQRFPRARTYLSRPTYMPQRPQPMRPMYQPRRWPR